ncbi:MAG: SDR family NAD(P)-dependent oxidoreductase, partial [Rhodospirillales bacterium]
MARVKGKVVIVTGGASGIGRATVELLTAEGATVVITDVNRKDGEALAASLGGAHSFALHDVSKEDQWQSIIGDTLKRFGRLDGLVNNAGVSGPVPAADLEHETLETWRKINTVN